MDLKFYLNNLNILYEDNHLLVVEKPINILSQKDDTGDIDMTTIIKSYLKIKYNKKGNVYLGLVHRLDRRVGGVMVFGKTSKASRRLSEVICNHKIRKRYLVYARGIIKKGGSIKIKIKKVNNHAIVASDGKESILDYQILNFYDGNTYSLVDLITGRYNQIRVSFMHIGHPLINDYKYDQTIKPNRNQLGLWCYQLELEHPVTKETMIFTSKPKGSIWKGLK